MSQITENTLIVRCADMAVALDALKNAGAARASIEYSRRNCCVIIFDFNGSPEPALTDAGVDPLLLETNYGDGDGLYRYPENETVDSVLDEYGVTRSEKRKLMKRIAYTL